MHALMNVVRRTWLATTLFAVVSTAIYWKWLDWEAAREHLLPTLILAPVIWWTMVGRKNPPHPIRGLAAGALTGFLAQMVPDMPTLWGLLSQRGKGDGEDQAIAIASAVFFLLLGAGGLMVGGLVGLLATAIDRRTQH